MKYVLITLGLLFSCFGYAQRSMNLKKKHNNIIKALKNQDNLYVSDVNTTHLIFNENIKYIDIGSPYFIADTIQPIVKLKHIGEGLDLGEISTRSNLTVITNGGTFYSIPLRYMRDTNIHSYRIGDSKENINSIKSSYTQKQEKTNKIDKLCADFNSAKSNIILTKERDNLRLKISGIFYQEDHIAIRLDIKNEATIDFDVDNILIRLKLNKKITSDYIYQERIISPIKICDKNYLIKGGDVERMTLIFDKFTPNDNEKLFIDVFEKNGGRSSTIAIPRKKLLTPKVVLATN
ncbi:DUF4138 domain-containing protein [Aquimarina sp. 2201CG14-23]|uniref:DUF4138 domain-containing protein n=1 Tax=Aquimarina mycalae TaxID=3040073 RepID=UPI00247816E3|nr:DUF4138 domain-containing protein [Aquimarina sp. 2201CG14-23]MDH7445849.1 DUF4138 domain-containing protein [Aquimarina sp. 2201CG14-23]